MSPQSLSPQLVLFACLLFNFLWTPKIYDQMDDFDHNSTGLLVLSQRGISTTGDRSFDGPPSILLFPFPFLFVAFFIASPRYTQPRVTK